jgi:DNA-binding PadR family transcriptional regulator
MKTTEQQTRIQIKNKFTERLITTFLDMIILTNFQNEPFSGYDVLLFIQRQFNIILSPGSVYSTVYSMERKKLITASSTTGKRTYKITQKGKLTANILAKPDEIQAYVAKLTGKIRTTQRYIPQ